MFYSCVLSPITWAAGVQARRVDRKRSDCSKAPRYPQKVDLCVLASFSCRVYAETQGRKVTCGQLNDSFQDCLLGGPKGWC